MREGGREEGVSSSWHVDVETPGYDAGNACATLAQPRQRQHNDTDDEAKEDEQGTTEQNTARNTEWNIRTLRRFDTDGDDTSWSCGLQQRCGGRYDTTMVVVRQWWARTCDTNDRLSRYSSFSPDPSATCITVFLPSRNLHDASTAHTEAMNDSESAAGDSEGGVTTAR